jgi:predicted MFS family arabinose efflux permease
MEFSDRHYIVGGKLITLFSQQKYFHLPFIGEIYSWQFIFFLFGLPGLIIALLIWMIKEPERVIEDKTQNTSFAGFVSYLKTDGKLFILLCLGASVFNIAVYGSSVWMPSFLTRVHHISMDKVGLILGLSTIVLPSIGVVIGGRVADYYARKQGISGRIKTMFLATLIFIPANILYAFTKTQELTICALLPQALLISASVGIGAACIQEVVPAQYRGIGSAVFLFSQNFIGMGLGPTLVALITDYVFCDPNSIGISMMIISVSSLCIAAFIFSKGLKKSLTPNA